MERENQKDYTKKIITIPNALSLLRLLLIPLIVWAYCVLKKRYLTISLLFVSGLTDIVDGIIARKFNMVSDVGKLLDPIADKLTQLAVFFCLMFEFYRNDYNLKLIMFITMIIVLVIKEVVQGISGIVLTKRCQKIFCASWWGKVSAGTIYLTVVIHLIWSELNTVVSVVSVSITIAFMVFATVMYLIRNNILIKQEEKEINE